MDSTERMRPYLGEHGSSLQQPVGSITADTSTSVTNNFGGQGHPNPQSRSPNIISYSPSRSPNLNLPPPPGLAHHGQPQYGGYPVFDNTSSVYTASPSYFPPQPQSPLYQNGYGLGHFGGCGGIGGELEGMYSYINMGMPLHQENTDCRFPPYSGRKLSLDDTIPDNLVEGKHTVFREPVIENVVGSFGTTNIAGTYTHFGPMNPLLTGLGVRNSNNEEQHQQQLEFQLQKQWQQQFELNKKHEQPQQKRVGQIDVTPPKNIFSSGPCETQMLMNGAIGVNNSPPKTGSVSVIGSGKLSPVNFANIGSTEQVPRSLTPNGYVTYSAACLKEQDSNHGGDTSSRGHVPGKPSYLEILTKNSSSNGTAATFRRTSSSSAEQILSSNSTGGDLDIPGPKRDSPPLTSNSHGHHIQPLLQLHLHGGTVTHRKSSDGFIVLNSSSPGTSNSSTASSSPITKPKTQQKGKENYLTSFIKSSKASFTTNGTPAHLNERKVQNSLVGNGKKVVGKPSKNQKFDFEIDDIDDDLYDGNSSLEPETEEKSSKKKGVKERKNVSIPINSSGNGSLNSKSGVEKFSSGGLGFGLQFGRKGREKTEKPRSRKEERNCLIRRFRLASKLWLGHLISALTWFWSLVVNVATLSAAVGYGLSEDLSVWWAVRALPWLRVKSSLLKMQVKSLWQKFKWREWINFYRKEPQKKTEDIEDLSDLLAMLGPERNIILPANGDEALRRLQSVKGQDPYSILGVRSNSPDETIRRYYKKQAVLVHPDKNLVPGAEEAFKILARAFELVGEPLRRMEYHKQLLEAHAKERFMGEFGNLFEQLRKKLESACTTIRCTKCNARHKKNRTNRPLFAARYCSQCRIHHGAREGELWAEKGGMFGFWTYYACMGNQIWEINEWGKCQSESLKHLNANSHNVLYRLVSGGQGQKQNRNSSQNTNNPGSPSEDDLLDPEIDDWDNLINNLCRGAANGTGAAGPSVPSTAQHGHKGTSTTTSNAHMNGNAGSTTVPNSSASTAPGRKRKGKRK